jgi:competence protein ComEC
MSEWNGEGMRFLDIHFLDVGHGDCTIIEFPGRLTMIDINNCKAFGKESEAELKNKFRPKAPNPLLGPYDPWTSNPYASAQRPSLGQIVAQMVEAEKRLKEEKDKLTNPIDYFKARFAGRSIFRYVQSHPDMDHMAGLYRLWVEEKIEIVNFWDTKHSIEKDEVAMRTGEVNHDIKDWHTYQTLRKRATNPTVLSLTYGASGDFYTPDGISVWAPSDHSQEKNPDCNPNDISYLLHIRMGECSIILGADATAETWEELYKRYKLPKINLLKASHHGRKSGYHMESVRAMNPDITVVSVGELKNKDDASASYERFSVKGCYSTVDHGDIIARCWFDGDVWLYDRDYNKIVSSRN